MAVIPVAPSVYNNTGVNALFDLFYYRVHTRFDSDASTNRHALQYTDRSRGLYSSSVIHNVSDDLIEGLRRINSRCT